MMFLPLYVAAFVVVCYFLGLLHAKKMKKCKHTDCAHFMIGKEQNYATVTIPINSGILLTLDDNPSTGYMWEVCSYDSNIIMQMNQPEHLPIQAHSATGDLLVGGGGHILWRFWAQKEGQTTIKLLQRQPWVPPGTDPYETEFYCTINVTTKNIIPALESVHV